MARQGTQRRILAVPDPKPSFPIDPILKQKDSGLQKCSCSTIKSKSKTNNRQPTTQSSDPLIPPNKSFFMTNNSSRLNLNHKNPTFNSTHHYHPQPPRIRDRDVHLQAKAMTVSADYAAYSSKFSRIKFKTHGVAKAKESLKEKVRKSSGDLDLDKKKEQHQHQHQQRSVLDSKKLTGFLTVNKDKQVKNNVGDIDKGPGRGRRRRSFGGSQVELGDILANCGVKIVSVDMPPFMQIHAVDCARKTHDSLENFTSKTLALTLKKEFDGVYGPAWHCIVGKSFGSFVTHSVGGFLYFSMDQKLHVLLFKTTVRRAD